MKERFLQFFTGKLSKSIYIAAASAMVCGAAVVTTVVVVHNNNQKIDAVLESVNKQAATTAPFQDTADGISVTVDSGINTTAQGGTANNAPTDNRALAYLAAYNRITEEYEKKKATLEKDASQQYVVPVRANIMNEPYSREAQENETPEEYAAYLETFQEQYRQWEAESRRADEFNRAEQSKADATNAKIENARKQMEQLQRQYEEDIDSLKTKYGIS